MTAGDLNGDGVLDLVVVNFGGASITVLLGVGDGSFVHPATYATGGNPNSAAIGDFNNDGKADVVVGNRGSNTLSVLIGNGDGALQLQVQYSGIVYPLAVGVGDFNHDGRLDVIAAGTGVAVFLGNGDGTLTLATNFSSGLDTTMQIADLNGDGNLDFAVTDEDSRTVQVFLGNGDGTFSQAPAQFCGPQPDGLALVDANGDGFLDAVVIDQYANAIVVLLNRTITSGKYSSSEKVLSVFENADAMAKGDFDGDGKIDLAVVSSQANSVAILYGNGDGTFQPAINYSVQQPVSVAAGDFNRDGWADFAVARNTGAVQVYLGNAQRTFRLVGQYDVGTNPAGMIAHDLNSDGILDLAVANQGAASVSVLLGNGDGTFGSREDYGVGAGRPYAITVADFNRDKKPDLAVADQSGYVSILLGTGSGAFSSASTISVGQTPLSIAEGDFNSDGNTDLVVADNGSLLVYVLPGEGDGTFNAPVPYTMSGNPRFVAVADFNRDGSPDLAVATGCQANNPIYCFNAIQILEGSGDGQFVFGPAYSVPVDPTALVATDLNHDGRIDLVSTNLDYEFSSTVSILMNISK